MGPLIALSICHRLGCLSVIKVFLELSRIKARGAKEAKQAQTQVYSNIYPYRLVDWLR